MKTSRDTTSVGRGRGRGATRGARGGRGAASNANSKSKVVASSGVFSEGAGDGATKRLMSRYRDAGDGDSASALRRPMITKKARADPEAEQKHMREIFDLDDDPMNGEDQLETDDFAPINMLSN